MVTGVVLLGVAWITATIGFRIHWSEIFSKKYWQYPRKCPLTTTDLKIEDTTGAIQKKILDEAKEEIKKEKSSRFKNELKIVDTNLKSREKTEEEKITEAKNKKLEGVWQPPTIDLLSNKKSKIVADEKNLRMAAEKIREKLSQFGIEVTMKSVHVGPTVTQFTLEPAAGVKLTKITSLKNDLALTLAAENIRIEAPIRGKSLVGIEIPNEKRANVSMREIIESSIWEESKDALKLAVGRDVSGKPIVVNLAKMPHLLMAGKTGSGKSVGMNAFLCSLLWNNSPEDLKLILIDPKRVELNRYKGLPHLLTPVIVEPEKSVSALAWAVAEMNRRYRMLSEAGVVNLDQYNEKFAEKKEPRIVIVIDELADLMMVAGKDVEAAVVRIAQLARAVGMHLIVATQRPSVDVVTGLIKANLPARISFKVSSQIDSRTIIDGMGAESLLGLGDMLYLDGNSGNLTRVQGIYISNEEVSRLTNFIKLQFPESIGNDEITQQSIEGMAKGKVLTAGLPARETDDADLDKLYSKAVEVVLQNKKASASFLQRRLEIGYARAARILDQMEERGIIGPSKGAKAREIYGERG
jgi:S-DNA-T family DNA segregation ATPase FtsK/SpoIIIE